MSRRAALLDRHPIADPVRRPDDRTVSALRYDQAAGELVTPIRDEVAAAIVNAIKRFPWDSSPPFGGALSWGATEYDLADAALTVMAAQVAERDAEIERLRADVAHEERTSLHQRVAEAIRCAGIAFLREHDPEWRDKPWMDGISVDLDEDAALDALTTAALVAVQEVLL